MHRFIRPIILLALIFSVPYLPAATLLLKGTQANIRFTQNELAGVDSHRALFELLLAKPNADKEESTEVILEKMLDVADQSSIILDPELASYHLVNILVNIIPYSVVALTQTNPTEILSNKSLLYSSANFSANFSENIARSLKQVVKGNAKTKDAVQKMMDNFTDCSAGIKTNPFTTVNQTQCITALTHLYTQAGLTLKTLLQQRLLHQYQLHHSTIFILLFTYATFVFISFLAWRNFVRKKDLETATQIIDVQTATEIQRQKLIEKLEATNTELEQFAHLASHDLKEPLRTMSGFASLLHSKYGHHLDSQGKNFLDHIIQASVRMQALINDMLDYAHINQSAIPSTLCNCENEAHIIINQLSHTIKETQALIHIKPLPIIKTNTARFSRVLQNLIVNALRYHRPSIFPEITIGCDERESEWAFWVQDNGMGIAPQHFDIIFEPFQRLHNQHDGVGKNSGTGIGLALCRKMVSSLGGHITVQSDGKTGSRFIFTLPKNG